MMLYTTTWKAQKMAKGIISRSAVRQIYLLQVIMIIYS
jgi:hypothetical protein